MREATGAQGSLEVLLPTSARWLARAATTVFPPATLAALAYYFAVKRQETLALYFGIDASVLGYTTEDYLLRSGDALFLLLLAGALVGLGATRGHGVVMRILHDPVRAVVVRRGTTAARALGTILLMLGVVSVFRRLPISPGFLFPPLALGGGITLLAYGTYLSGVRSRGRDEGYDRSEELWLRHLSVVLVAVVVVLSAFWGTKELAAALGRGQAAELSETLAQRPGVILYTTGDIGLSGPGIDREVLPGAGDYRYRYEGLVLLVRSGGNFLLLPASWTPRAGAAVLIKDDNRVRIEFTPHGEAQ